MSKFIDHHRQSTCSGHGIVLQGFNMHVFGKLSLLACTMLIVLLCATVDVKAATCPIEPGYEPFEEYCEGPDCETEYRAFCGPPGGESFDSTTTSTRSAGVTSTECASIATECSIFGVSASCGRSIIEYQCKQLHSACGGDRACVMEELNRMTEIFGGSCPASSTTTTKAPAVECSGVVARCSIPGLNSSCANNLLSYQCQQINSATCHGDTSCLTRVMDAFVKTVGGTCDASGGVNCDDMADGCSLGGGLSATCGANILRHNCRQHEATSGCRGDVTCVSNGVKEFAEKLGGSCSSTPTSPANCTDVVKGCTLNPAMPESCQSNMIMYECEKINAVSCSGDLTCTKEKVSELCRTFGGGCGGGGGMDCSAIVASTSHVWGGGISTTCQDTLLNFKCKEFAIACGYDEDCVTASMNDFVHKFT